MNAFTDNFNQFVYCTFAIGGLKSTVARHSKLIKVS